MLETLWPQTPLKHTEIKKQCSMEHRLGEEHGHNKRRMVGSEEGGTRDNACRTGPLTSEDKIIFRGQASKTPRLPPSPLLPSLLSSLNMDNDCLHLQNHKSEVPIATEQLARLPIIIIINHADFTVFSRTAGDCEGQGAAGASGTARQAGKGRVACRGEGEEGEGGRVAGMDNR